MKILITPENIIKRCLWSRYKKYILNDKKKSEIVDIVSANELISLTENDAYVIGLLKVIETDNLVHRFRLEIEDFVKIKTTVNKERVIINKNAILNEVREFKARFPIEYKASDYYQSRIDEMKEYVDSVYIQIDELSFIELTFKEREIAFVYSKEVNKIIKFKN